jgi:hypothetical protein
MKVYLCEYVGGVVMGHFVVVGMQVEGGLIFHPTKSQGPF